MATFDERMCIMDNKRLKANKRLKYLKTTQKKWYDFWGRGGRPSRTRRSSILWRIYNGHPIYQTEYKYLVNSFKQKGLTFSFPLNKIKFI